MRIYLTLQERAMSTHPTSKLLAGATVLPHGKQLKMKGRKGSLTVGPVMGMLTLGDSASGIDT